VWITKPSEREHIDSVLVAHDLGPVGTLALQLGASISQLQNSALHVLHIVDRMGDAELKALDDVSATLADRKSIAHSQILAELQSFKFAVTPRIAIDEGDAAELILKYIDDYGIELLAMGTIARSGISGVITGNTAERLLARIPCSVLAVKPSDFWSDEFLI
jgi:universal stress protein E